MVALNRVFAELVHHRIHACRGIKGVALRAGVGALAAAQPAIVERASARLLPEFVDALEPLYAEYRKSTVRATARAGSFGHYLLARRREAVDVMMARADQRAARTKNALYGRFYRTLRGTIAAEADAIMPTLAEHLDAALAIPGSP